MDRQKIYFAGSIRGGRDDRYLYESLISYLGSIGEVLTESNAINNNMVIL